MNVVSALAEILGAVFVLVGLSMFNQKSFNAAMNDFKASRGLTWTIGLVTFVGGAVVISLYNVWSSSWEVLITLVGWLMLIKGAFITLFPTNSLAFYRRFTSNSFLAGAGFVAIVVGLVLFYLGFTA